MVARLGMQCLLCLVAASAIACTDDGGAETSSTDATDATDDAPTGTDDSTSNDSTATDTTSDDATETTADSTSDTDDSTSNDTGLPPGCELPEAEGGFMAYCSPADPTCADGFGCYLFQTDIDPEQEFVGLCSRACETDADCVWGPDDSCSDERFICQEATSGTKRCVQPCMADEACFPGQDCVPPFAVCLTLPP